MESSRTIREQDHVSRLEKPEHNNQRKSDLGSGSDLEMPKTEQQDWTDTGESTQESPDPNIVTWDGPGDPQNPMNWSLWRKVVCLGIVSFLTFLSPLASSFIAPGTQSMMRDFGSADTYIATFIVSGYVIGYCCGPLIIAPLSELYGRRPVYVVCNFVFFIFNVACALAPSPGSLIVFRIFAGIGGSCPLTLGAASIADMVPRERRGAAMTAWILGPLLGPTVGPIAGGYLSQATSWRWMFWVLTIASGIATIVTIIFMPESYAYIILDKRTKRLRKETGNANLRSSLDTGRTARELISFSIVRPFKMLLFSPIIALLSLYLAVVYGYLYILFTTFPKVFGEQYGFSEASTGLSYLGIAIGSLVSLVITGLVSDPLVAALQARSNGVFKAEYRLPLMAIGGVVIPAGLFWYGWSAYYKVHWIVPIVGTGFLGLGMILQLMGSSTYLVDAFTVHAASAIAANTVVRSLFGAFLPLAGPSLYRNLGLNWGNSLLGFISLAMIPIPFLFLIYGERIRSSKLFEVKF